MEQEYTNTLSDNEEGRTDFYVIIDYKKLRGVKVMKTEDADGDFDTCLIIPMLKNGIKNYGRNRWRVILAARKSHRNENASHVLIPQVEDTTQRGMVKNGYIDRYKYLAPIVGDVVPDITKIPIPPVFSKNSQSHISMMENMTANPDGGLVSTESGISTDSGLSGQKYLTEAQKRIREMLLKRKKE